MATVNLMATTQPRSAMRHQLITIILQAADIKITSESIHFFVKFY